MTRKKGPTKRFCGWKIKSAGRKIKFAGGNGIFCVLAVWVGIGVCALDCYVLCVVLGWNTLNLPRGGVMRRMREVRVRKGCGESNLPKAAFSAALICVFWYLFPPVNGVWLGCVGATSIWTCCTQFQINFFGDDQSLDHCACNTGLRMPSGGPLHQLLFENNDIRLTENLPRNLAK